MTMIFVATYGDHAEIITDSAAYRRSGHFTGTSTKVMALPHLDAAVMTQGDLQFGVEAKASLLLSGGQSATFDELVDAAPQALAAHWHHSAERLHANALATIVLVGYSHRDGAFAAWSFSSDQDDFTPVRLPAIWGLPTPLSHRPNDLDVARFLADDAAAAAVVHATPIGPRIESQWRRQPDLPRPRTVEQWVALAQLVRQERALAPRNSPFDKVFVAGDVFHTRLEQGTVTTTRIHTFNDQGEEFLSMIEGTRHPVAQQMPCWCGSGDRSIDCHLGDSLDESCVCGSGRAFRVCCADQEPATPVRGHA